MSEHAVRVTLEVVVEASSDRDPGEWVDVLSSAVKAGLATALGPDAVVIVDYDLSRPDEIVVRLHGERQKGRAEWLSGQEAKS